MLKLAFNQFKCWDKLVLEIPLGCITLIKGKSGSGKTSIFTGIIWCLFGRVVRKISPSHCENAKTKVTLQIPYKSSTLTLERFKNPSRLILSLGDTTYEDSIAQSIITEIFGTYDIWLASCYIPQHSRNSFLTSPNDGKMELLNKIAFHEEDPAVYINKIDTHIISEESSYKTYLNIFNQGLSTLQTQLNNVDVSKALPPDQITYLKSSISSLQYRYSELSKIKNNRDINIGILNNLNSQLDQISKKYSNLPVITLDPSIQNLYDKFGHSQLTEILPLLSKRDNLKSQLSSLHSQLSSFNLNDFMNYSNSDYDSAISTETLYNQTKNLLHRYGLNFDRPTVELFILKQKNLLLAQETKSIQSKISALTTQLNNLSVPIIYPEIIAKQIPIPDFSKYDTSSFVDEINTLLQKQGSLQLHIQHLQKGFDVIECPKCAVPLRYQSQTGILVEADMAPINKNDLVTSNQELQNVKTQIAQLNTKIKNIMAAHNNEKMLYEKLVRDEDFRINSLNEKVKYIKQEENRRAAEIQVIQSTIDDLTKKLNPDFINEHVRLLSEKEIDQIKTTISILSNINYIDPPKISSKYIKDCLNCQNINIQYASIKNNLDEVMKLVPEQYQSESLAIITAYSEKIKKYINNLKAVEAEKLKLDNQKIAIEEQIQSVMSTIVDDPSDEINKLSDEIQDLKNKIELSDNANQIIEFHTKISKQRDDLIKLTDNISDLRLFKQYALETECKILQEIVDSINSNIQSVCNSIFDDDIIITLNLFKTLKTTKNIKPKVNFTISYKGGIFEDINQMSGGEGDRASLALTLALKRLSSCPFLLLDESLASLNIDIKESAIKAMRENTNDTIIIIMHDGIEGVFDHVIDIDSL